MKKCCFLIILVLFIPFSVTCVQESFTELNLKAKVALKSKNYDAAEKLFYQSIMQNKDADSYYEYGNLLNTKNTFESRALARESYKAAVLRDPKNITYRFTYAKLCAGYSKGEGIQEYEKIIELDEKNIDAYVHLGKLCSEEYEELFNARRNTERGNVYLESANEKYSLAEKYYVKALSLNKFSVEANLGLARLYAGKRRFNHAIILLNFLFEKNPNVIDLNLYSGIYNYRVGMIKPALAHFQKALSLMTEEERKVYTLKSVQMFLEPGEQKKFELLSEEEKINYLQKYWEMKDPLFLSDENERLAEHYFRVAYSNLYFGIPMKGIPGWQSDRGKVFISFGEPVSEIKIHTVPRINITEAPTDAPLIVMGKQDDVIPGDAELANIHRTFRNSFGQVQGGPGTEYGHTSIWNYPDGKRISFDYLLYNSYKLSWKEPTSGIRYSIHPITGSVSTSLGDYEDLMYNRFSESKLSGSNIFVTPLQINIFRSLQNPSMNEVYFSYIMPMPNYPDKEAHEYCLYLQNNKMEFVSQKKGRVKTDLITQMEKEKRPDNEKINTISTTLKPGRHSFAFETRTIKDSMASSLHKEYDFPVYQLNKLDMSSIVFASRVEEGNDISGSVKRKNISFLPRMGRQFKAKESFYLYYEVYNLLKSAKELTDFEQKITIRNADEKETGIPVKSIIKGIVNLISGSSKELSLTSFYKTAESDSQVFLQLDFSDYKQGKYELIITITDKISGSSVERKTDLEIL